MEKTAEKAPPVSVRIVMQSSELHRMAPSDARFASLGEINEKRDPTVACVIALASLVHHTHCPPATGTAARSSA
jgi:hypothetical protein